jgi:hypothetical protein
MIYDATIGKVWKKYGKLLNLRLRFCDWNHEIKYFQVLGESQDGKRLLGCLDTGEKISFSKKSIGWNIYQDEQELRARAV